ncbi:MAG TPA: lipase family protein [Terriglobales bacterium]|nr:lipase family protein [Terriglobales bacterium]
MIPFDGQFAEQTMLPLAAAAYDGTQPPQNFVLNQTAFEILANPAQPSVQNRMARLDPAQKAKHQKVLQSMLSQPKQPKGAASDTAVRTLAAAPAANLHFGWFCLDQPNNRLIAAFRGTEFIHDWLDDFDFVPAPYAPVPGRGTVHQGFQLVYLTIRDNLIGLLNQHSPGFNEILITGHSLGGALCALAAVDIVNVNTNLAPVVYTWAEPRVGHDDFITFYNTHINICYRVVNVWDVVPHLPPDIAGYGHEGNQVTIDSGFSLDVVHNHVLATGYVPGMHTWNQNHPVQSTQHMGRMAVSAMVGQVR